LLRSNVILAGEKQYTAQVNPYTELATASALVSAGGLSESNVKKAWKALREVLPVDVISTAPTFAAGSCTTPTNSTAIALTALSKIAAAGDLGCTGTQADKVACVTSKLADQGINDSIKLLLQAKLADIATTAALPSITLGTTTSVIGTTPTAIEQAKAFMGTLVSNAQALGSADLTLDTDLVALRDDLMNWVLPASKVNIEALRVAKLGTDFYNDVIKGSTPFVATRTFYEGGTYTDTYSSYNPVTYAQTTGDCGFYSDTEYKIRATSKTDAKYVACGTPKKYVPATNALGEYKSCTAVGELCYSSWSVRVRVHPDTTVANKFTVYTQTREAKYTRQTDGTIAEPLDASKNPIGRTHYGATLPGNAATLLVATNTNNQVTAVNLTGEMSPAFSIGGGSVYYDSSLMRTVYKENTATVLGDKHNIAINAAWTQGNGLDKLALSGSIGLVKGGVQISSIELSDGSYLQAKPTVAGSTESYIKDSNQELALSVKFKSAHSAIIGGITANKLMYDKSNTDYRPTVVTFNGSVQHQNTGTAVFSDFFNGSVKVEALNYGI
jgi:hypothetical protein